MAQHRAERKVLGHEPDRIPPQVVLGEVGHALAVTVAPGDHHAVADALARVLDRGREAFGPALARAAEDYEWHHVAEPLLRWVAGGRPRPTRATKGGRTAAADQRARSLMYRVAGRRLLALRRGDES